MLPPLFFTSINQNTQPWGWERKEKKNGGGGRRRSGKKKRRRVRKE